MMSRKFQRKIEDFVCENCAEEVSGNGYTNHCPKCLWSKHVDNNPGDRQNPCGGLMEPIEAFFRSGEWVIVHKCQKCRKEKNNQISEGDNLEVLKGIMEKDLT